MTTNHHVDGKEPHHNKYTDKLTIVVLLLLLIIVILAKCESCKGNGNVKVEPVIIKVKDSSTTKPVPVNIEVIEPGRIPELASSKPYIITKHDTTWIFEKGIVDTLAILKDYFAKVIYKDTLHTKYGNITVWDTITRNRIEGRKFLADLNIPSEIIYVTNPTPQPKKRNEVYFSMGGLYNNTALSVGGGLLLKTKRERIYNANAYLGTDGQITYNFQTALKIKLKK